MKKVPEVIERYGAYNILIKGACIVKGEEKHKTSIISLRREGGGGK
jgi:hypothetical protein